MNYSHFVGLDVGKKTFDASLMSADEKELSHKSFDNTPEGIQSLLDWIAGYHLSLSKLLFCAENMGSYVTELSVSSVSMGFFPGFGLPVDHQEVHRLATRQE